MSFKAGDEVQLKSGGPVMTVEYIRGEEVGCIWFLNNKPETHVFNSATLKAYSPPQIRM